MGPSTAAEATPGAVMFRALTRVSAEGGLMQADDHSLTVTGANAATILVSIESNYREL